MYRVQRVETAGQKSAEYWDVAEGNVVDYASDQERKLMEKNGHVPWVVKTVRGVYARRLSLAGVWIVILENVDKAWVLVTRVSGASLLGVCWRCTRPAG